MVETENIFVSLNIDTVQAYALDAVLGIMQAGFKEAIKQPEELERLAATKNFDQKVMALVAVDVFLNNLQEEFNELDAENLPKDDAGKPFAKIEIETDGFTALSIYNLCGFAALRHTVLEQFEKQVPGLDFTTLASLREQVVKVLNIEPEDTVLPTQQFQAPPKKGQLLN